MSPFFIVRMTGHWHMLPRAVVESVSIDIQNLPWYDPMQGGSGVGVQSPDVPSNLSYPVEESNR